MSQSFYLIILLNELINDFLSKGIRNRLLESDSHECPECHEHSVSPDSLIPNRFLRTSVSKFKNDTGYCGNRNRSVPNAANHITRLVVEQNKPEVKQNDVKVNDVVNSPKPVDIKPIENELKSEPSPPVSATQSPVISNHSNDSTEVTMDEVILDSSKNLSHKSVESVGVNGQTSGLSDELISCETFNEIKELNDR